MNNGNNNLLMFVGLAISSLGMWYLYSNRNKEMELEIKAMKTVKYTNIDNLISKNKNSEYLSITNSSNAGYTSNSNHNNGMSNNSEKSNFNIINGGQSINNINNSSSFERLDNDKDKDESISKKGFFSSKYF